MPARYTELLYHQACFKDSHNSYQRDEDIHVQIDWDESQNYQGGCRGVEIDITRHTDASGGRSVNFFQVSHSQGGNGPPLASYLGYLLSWHVNNPGHDVICVHLDIKSEAGDYKVFPAEINTYLTEWFLASCIYTPYQLAGEKDLVAYVKDNGWPSIGALADQFIIVLSGYEKWKSYYAGTDRASQLCFADIDVSDSKEDWPPETGNRAIANMHLYSDHKSTWTKTVAHYRGAKFLVRGYVLDGEGLWGAAQSAGVNMLATDEVENHEWAAVGDEPFVSAPSP